jgi:hypothetical protein
MKLRDEEAGPAVSLVSMDACAPGKDPPCPDRSGRDDGPRDLSPDPQGFRSSGPCSIRARRIPPWPLRYFVLLTYSWVDHLDVRPDTAFQVRDPNEFSAMNMICSRTMLERTRSSEGRLVPTPVYA